MYTIRLLLDGYVRTEGSISADSAQLPSLSGIYSDTIDNRRLASDTSWYSDILEGSRKRTEHDAWDTFLFSDILGKRSGFESEKSLFWDNVEELWKRSGHDESGKSMFSDILGKRAGHESEKSRDSNILGEIQYFSDDLGGPSGDIFGDVQSGGSKKSMAKYIGDMFEDDQGSSEALGNNRVFPLSDTIDNDGSKVRVERRNGKDGQANPYIIPLLL